LKARIFMPRSDMPEILLMAISNDWRDQMQVHIEGNDSEKYLSKGF
jgi:hypothetical protein